MHPGREVEREMVTEQKMATERDIRHDWRIEEVEAIRFFAGVGSIFCGDRLLTTPSPSFAPDTRMLSGLGLEPRAMSSRPAEGARP